MKHFPRYLVLFTVSSFFFACGGNPGWDGHHPANSTEELARETCRCVFEVMSGIEGLDADLVLEEMKGYAKRDPNAGLEEVARSWPEVTKALAMEEEISIRVDDSDCLKPLEERIFKEGVDFDEMMDEVDRHCWLGVFYN